MPENVTSSRKTGEGSPGNSTTRARPSDRPLVPKREPTQPLDSTVSDVMSRDVDFCTPECSVQAVARMMAERNVGSIPVVDNTDHMVPIGMMTDRDIVVRVIAPGHDPRSVRVDQCMSLDVQTIPSNAPANEAAAIMQRLRLHRLPVIDDTGCLVGILSHSDLSRPRS